MHKNDEELFKNPQILKMLYAVEWYDVPKFDHGKLVEFHPELTQGDNEDL